MGLSQPEAYKAVYGKAHSGNASRVGTRPDVRARIQTLLWTMAAVDMPPPEESGLERAQVVVPAELSEDGESGGLSGERPTQEVSESGESDEVRAGGENESQPLRKVVVRGPHEMLAHLAQKQALQLRELERVAQAEIAWEDVKASDKVRALQAYLVELRELIAETHRQLEQEKAEGKAERNRAEEEHRRWLHERTAADRARDVVAYLRHALEQGYESVADVLVEAEARVEELQTGDEE